MFTYYGLVRWQGRRAGLRWIFLPGRMMYLGTNSMVSKAHLCLSMSVTLGELGSHFAQASKTNTSLAKGMDSASAEWGS